MKQKNRNHPYKRLISPRKFARLLNSNLDKAGFAYITKDWNTKRSLQAVKINNIIYAQFATNQQKANRLETYCVRYKVEDGMTEDFIAFSPFPIQVF